MKQILSWITLITFALILAGCAGTKTVEIEQRAENDVRPPNWYPNPDPKDDYIFAATTSLSMDLQVAVDKATVMGREELGKQLDLKLRTIESHFEEETGFMKDAKLESAYKSAVNVATENTLVGSRIKDKHLVREGEMWRAYILMELPMAQVKKALVNGVKANEALLKKLGSTKAFKEIGG